MKAARQIDPVGGSEQLVVHSSEVQLDFAGKHLLTFEIDAIVDVLPDRVAKRR